MSQGRDDAFTLDERHFAMRAERFKSAEVRMLGELDLSVIGPPSSPQRAFAGNGRRLRISGSGAPQVQRVMELTGVDELLPFEE
jgi:hypothetical protein